MDDREPGVLSWSTEDKTTRPGIKHEREMNNLKRQTGERFYREMFYTRVFLSIFNTSSPAVKRERALMEILVCCGDVRERCGRGR